MRKWAVGVNYIRAVNSDDPLRVGELLLEADDLDLCVIDYSNGIARQMTQSELDTYNAAISTKEAQLGIDKTDIAAAVARLTQIVSADPATITNAQAVSAIQDIAKYLRALIRVVT